MDASRRIPSALIEEHAGTIYPVHVTQADGTEYVVPAEAVKQPEHHFSAASNAKAPRYCQHGTQGRWLEGCRCKCCVSAHRAALRAARLAKEQAR